MLFARVTNGVVMELYTPPDGVAITDCFHADIAAEFLDITNVTPQPHQRWTFNGTVYAPPTIP